MTPEYWAQAQAVQAAALSQGQVRPGTALINPQNLAAVATAVAAATGQPVPGQEYFPMDEREQKRQRRKQSNRYGEVHIFAHIYACVCLDLAVLSFTADGGGEPTQGERPAESAAETSRV
jgi:hypothetical protein